LRLDIGYLWIDALCIIQDSHTDWAHEAGCMTQVYANSFLNISEADSSDSTKGLFRDRDPLLFQAFRFDKGEHQIPNVMSWHAGTDNVRLSPDVRIPAAQGCFIAYANTWNHFVYNAPL
jgi:hypothetical protein